MDNATNRPGTVSNTVIPRLTKIIRPGVAFVSRGITVLQSAYICLNVFFPIFLEPPY